MITTGNLFDTVWVGTGREQPFFHRQISNDVVYLCVKDKNDYLELYEKYVNNKEIDITVWELNKLAVQYAAKQAA